MTNGDKMKIEIGKIVKAQGINGEVKSACFVDEVNQLKHVKTAYIEGRAYEVVSLRGSGEFFFMRFAGVDTRNDAEELRGKTIYADKNEVDLADDRYFIDDLVGCGVYLDGNEIGQVTEVLQYGSADVFVCKATCGNDFSFPFLKDAVASVDVDDKRINVQSKRFAEVVCYED